MAPPSPDRLDSAEQDALRDDLKSREGVELGQGWTLGKLLGVGPTAGLFSADGPGGSKAIAKLLHEPDADGALHARFSREATISRRVKSPAQVSVLAHGETATGEAYLVLERIDGIRVLDQFASRRPAEVSRALSIVTGVARGLVRVHREGVVHRALGPGTLFLEQDDSPRVLDFGASHVDWEDVTSSSGLLGPPDFMSPEVARQSTVDARADVFSLGAVLYWLLTDQPVRSAASGVGRLAEAATTPLPRLGLRRPDLPASLLEIVDRAVSFDASERFADADALLAALEPIESRGENLRQTLQQAVGQDVDHGLELLRVLKRDNLTDAERAVADALRSLGAVADMLFQHGWDSPAAAKAKGDLLRALHQAIAGSPQGEIAIEVLPDALSFEGTAAWAPCWSPRDFPFRLFDSGLRQLKLRAGLDADELDRLLAALLGDRGTGPGGPVASLLARAGLHSVTVETAHMLERPMANWGLEALSDNLHEIEEAAHAVLRQQPPDAELAARRKRSEALTAGHTGLAGVGLVRRRTEEEERLPALLAAALDDARRHGDPQLIVDPLLQRVHGQIGANRADLALELYRGLALSSLPEAVLSDLRDRMFPEPVLASIMSQLTRRGSIEEETLDGLDGLLESLGSRSLDLILKSLKDVGAPGLRDRLVAMLGRHVNERTEALGDAIERASPDIAVALLALLDESESNGTLVSLRRASKSPYREVWEAAFRKRLKRADKDVWRELDRHLNSDEVTDRVAILALAREFRVTQLARRLSGDVHDPEFHSRDRAERRALLETYAAIDAKKARQFLVDLLRKKSLVANKEREDTRLIGVEILRSMEPHSDIGDALRQASRPRWWNSKELQELANDALVRYDSMDSRFLGTDDNDRSPLS